MVELRSKKAINAQVGEIGVVGGTFIENSDSSTPNTEEFDIMINAAKKFYGLPTDTNVETVEENNKAA